MSRCVPFAIAAILGDTHITSALASCEDVGWTAALGATPRMAHAVLMSREVHAILRDGGGVPSQGILFVSGDNRMHAVAVVAGQVYDIRESQRMPLKQWVAKHGTRYPRVTCSIEIRGNLKPTMPQK